jgi:putative ABC transport system permease protein
MIGFLSWRSLRNRKFISFLCVLSISLSLALFLIVDKLRQGVEEGFTNTISNADLIVGASSGQLQLLLYSVFHMGSPTNNISYETYEKIRQMKSVEWTIPISLGDSYRGFRVVATDENFLAHYQFHRDRKLSLREGQWFAGVFDVVLGARVAKSLKHAVGDPIVLSHGLSEESFLKHDETPFRVTGILNSTGTPLDKSVFISLHGMEAIHVGWETGAPTGEVIEQSMFAKENLKVEQLTSLILRSKNRMALLGLQRNLAQFQDEPLTAIIPAMALTELWGLLDQLEKAFQGIGLFVILIGFLSVLISLYMSLNERKREMAILRSLGVSTGKITLLFLGEATFLALIGAVVGHGLHYLILFSIAPVLESWYALAIPIPPPSLKDAVVVGVFVLLGPISGLLPAIKANRTALHNGLKVS